MTSKHFTSILCLIIFATSLIAQPPRKKPKFETDLQIDPSQIDIVRDSFGVPHIFAKTDAEVAYGLAWATAEDDVENSQFMLLAIRGVLGKHLGIDGAKIDFAVQMMGVNDYVYDNYEELVADDYKKVLEGYCLGINAYAKEHPERIWMKKLFPVVPQDLVVGHMLGVALMGGIKGTIESILDGRVTKNIPWERSPGGGSNAFAMNGNITADGNTYLAVNAHQPLEGLLSWYEAHLHSDEGWNAVGALFHGSCQIYLGTNENLGWGHTTGQLDMTDIYKLDMHPKKNKLYKFDGKWHKLKTKHARLRVGLGKKHNFILPVTKKFWISKYGPTLKTKKYGTYAIRMPAIMDMYPAEQWYRMNKASNFEEFYQALEIQGLAMQNITYADKDGNIFFIANGVIPRRTPGYEWKKVLPGDTSATLWTEYLGNDELCSFKNPECGWLFNTNNTGLHATCKEEIKKLEEFNPYIGYNNERTNRSLRTYEFMEALNGRRATYQDFKDLKFDIAIPEEPIFKDKFSLKGLFELDPEKYPDIADAIELIKTYDKTADLEDRNYPIVMYTIYQMLRNEGKYGREDLRNNDTIREEFFVRSVTEAKAHMMKHFGTMDKSTADVQVVERGGKALGVAGGPDMNRAVFGSFMDDGRVRMTAGDGYYQLVQFTENGPIIETIHALGASSYPESPHYNDQMDLYVQHKLKPMPLEKEKVYEMAERVYHPK